MMRSPAKRQRIEQINAYAGWRLSGVDAAEIGREETGAGAVALSPRSFFTKYVAQRKPVVLSDASAALGAEWKGSKWTAAYLDGVVGAAPVRVERRDSPRSTFGRGNHLTMPFSSFQAKLHAGARDLYLTTQDIGVDGEGRPALVSTPCAELHAAGDFALRPPLAGGLVLMNVNLWYGSTGPHTPVSTTGGAAATPAGSSSGLHHDFHDNFYILLRGAKRFRLFSPADAERLATAGHIAKVYPNGRIVYSEADADAAAAPPAVFADGTAAAARRAMAADVERAAAEDAIADARAQLAAGGAAAESAGERLRVAEEALESALEAAMDAELGWGDGGDEEEDYVDSDVDEGDDEDVRGGTGGSDGARGAMDGDAAGGEAATPTPDNFSAIDLTLSASALRARWPALGGAVTTTVTVHAGEMLYLPAGWFHEVTSLGGSGSGSAAASEGDVNGAHMAFNYWFHPPDTGDFNAPYSCNFWEWEWAQRGLGARGDAATPSR